DSRRSEPTRHEENSTTLQSLRLLELPPRPDASSRHTCHCTAAEFAAAATPAYTGSDQSSAQTTSTAGHNQTVHHMFSYAGAATPRADSADHGHGSRRYTRNPDPS